MKTMEAVPPPRGVAWLDPELARQSQFIRIPRFLAQPEAQLLLDAAERHKERHENTPGWYGGDQLGKLYLQDGGLPAVLEPVVARISKLVRRVDREHWGVLSEVGGEIEPRCVEFHEYSEATKTECPVHVDTGSLFTADVMLSPSGQFEGGEMLGRQWQPGARHLDSPPPFEHLDCLVFLSHKAHCVAPMTRGLRVVLVIEFWQRGACSGNHRCMGQCVQPACTTGQPEGRQPIAERHCKRQRTSTRSTGSQESRVHVSYTHLRAHETPEHLVCRLLLEKKKK
eukprot:TRINITY_DN51577_c0_g2_i1.p1 TRINITY_DN51577_c0_g2~~TRINITY_DN51577_c0_g2_i1.p1  ORF type:complete len:283 (-),score=47.76 TRINITY_DN51577_c0_g2_i1:27-875(-)